MSNLSDGFQKITGFRNEKGDMFVCSCGKRTRRTVEMIDSCPDCMELDQIEIALSDGHYETAEQKAALEAKADKLAAKIEARSK